METNQSENIASPSENLMSKQSKLAKFKHQKGGNIFVRFARSILIYWNIYLLFIPGALVIFIFNYLPMAGLIVSLKDFKPRLGMWGSPFQTPLFANFQELFDSIYFWKVLKNTLLITLAKQFICFPAPIVLALIFNEIKIEKYKRVVQTVLYLPHFLSWVILAGMFNQILGHDGMVNTVLANMGLEKVGFLTEGKTYFWFLILSDMWQNCGFASIMYLASMASIDTSLYEAAKIDGANRWVIMWKITLPALIPITVLQLILNVAGLLDGGFGQIYNTYSIPVYETADILDTYLYRTGITDGNIESATALSCFKSLIGLVLVLTTNKIADKLSGEGIF